MAALGISAQDQAATLVAVSNKYQIPMQALLGIYGQETGFGQDTTTSSAGAVGPFQFIQSTAAQYNYPYTNTPTLAQFQQQADAWGRLLVANNPSRSASGWAPAMRGGYTEAQAESKIAGMPSSLKNAIVQLAAGKVLGSNTPTIGIFGIAPDPKVAPGVSTKGPLTSGPPAGLEAIGAFFSSLWTGLTNPSTWLRIGEFIGGAVLIFMALKSLTGVSVPSVPIPVEV